MSHRRLFLSYFAFGALGLKTRMAEAQTPSQVPRTIRGKSGRVYEILEIEIPTGSDGKPLIYVVKFRAENLSDIPALLAMVEELRPTFQQEAEKSHVNSLALLAVRTIGFGGLSTSKRHGFVYTRTGDGVWERYIREGKPAS